MKYVYHKKPGSHELATRFLRSMINGNYGSLIDLCCCFANVTGTLGFQKRKYLDVIPRQLDHNEQEHFVQADVLKDHPLFEEHWDVATCLDGIEHVTKDEGQILVDRMLEIADIAIVFTPADAWMMEEIGSERYLNDPESHKSLWAPEDFEGWASILMPNYHPTLGIGAFFSWYNKNVNMEEDFNRVKQELGLK